jgi:2-keto-4-pentenoate hydratase/2-oxohepta-3-ene-1,7-dioic acid hydratase in catechol pathway
VGLLFGDLVFDLARNAQFFGDATLDYVDIDQGLDMGTLQKLPTVDDVGSLRDGIPLTKVRMLAPILRPEKIFCVALNYVSHGKEQSVAPPSTPYFFTKFRNTIVGPEDDILVPRISNKVDWEVELVVVIGKTGKYISKEKAMDYVAGYTVGNDISFRDLQFPPGWPQNLNALGQNWVKGKGLDTAFPLGPCLVTKEEIVDPYNLRISLSVNGDVRQDSTTAEMIFRIDSLIESLSNGITLRPGDIISTGTPFGVATFTGKPFLKSGDVVASTIESIGTLRNKVKAEA